MELVISVNFVLLGLITWYPIRIYYSHMPKKMTERVWTLLILLIQLFTKTKGNFIEKFATINLRNRDVTNRQLLKRMKIIAVTLYLNESIC